MDAHLIRRFKGVGTGFSIEAQNATEKESVTDRVPSLKRHLMKEIGGIPPWEEEMLTRMKGNRNAVPYPSTLPFPSPSRSKLKYFSPYAENGLHWRGPSHGCEDMQLEFLYRHVSKRKAQFVQWVTWVNLDTPAPGQPLQITRLSTTLDRYIPEMELKFDEDRLRELEEGADQVVPDPTKLSDKPYMLGMCDKRFRNYVKYIAQKEGVPEADLMTDLDISQGVVMWLLTGKVHPRKPDNLDHWRGPYSTLHYKDHYGVPRYYEAEGEEMARSAKRLLEGTELFQVR
ncbi:hypothetical protein FOZ60_005145 [Perkinsus olseni]|uniref:Uncharacterized protein n=1 Tax=Perkinsus olseni TaxID=32597 RepID=A0A7J6PGH8_PEROL|nr:hypothetical protein FOZ60_005145 [Perkinsus olseni]